VRKPLTLLQFRLWVRLRSFGPAARALLARLLTNAKAIGWIPIHALALSAALLWVTAYLFPREFEIPVKAASLVPNGGHAFAVRLVLPNLPPYSVFRTDGVGAETSSALELAEDGRALGPPHALHAEIREKGAGRFSYWNHGLYFSTSDNSTPQVNGRVYTAKIPAAPSVWLGWTAIGLIMLSLSLLPVVRKPFRFIPVTALTVVGSIAATCFIVLWNWLTGASASLSVAGIYPVSDALGYVTCSNLLLDRGARFLFGTVIPLEVDVANLSDARLDLSIWCQDRPFFYSGFLASVFALVGRGVPTAMMFQAGVIGFSLGLFARAVARFAGLGGALVAAAVLLLFAREHALPMLVTENLGLACGTIAIVLLLEGARQNNNVAVLGGFGLLAFALQVRPGALCVLPMIMLWAAVVAWQRQRPLLPSLSQLILVLGAISLLQPLMLWANDGSFMHLHGSFSYILYGLSVGGGGWGRLLLDHPELFSRTGDPHPLLTYEIFRLAIQNILASPQLFIRAVVSNLNAYWSRQFDFISSTMGYRLPFRLLWIAGGVSAIVNWRDRPQLLIGLMSLGEVLSGPVIIEEGGNRLLAATVPIQAVQAALGFGWACSWIRRVTNADASHASRTDDLSMRGLALLPALSGILMIVATLLPYSLALSVAARRPIAADACMDGTSPVVVRLGLETNALFIAPDNTSTSHLPREVRAGDLRRGLEHNPTWFSEGFAALVPGEWVLQGFQSTPNEFDVLKPILWRGWLPSPPGTVAQFCIDQHADVKLAGISYYRARSVVLLSDFEPLMGDLFDTAYELVGDGRFLTLTLD